MNWSSGKRSLPVDSSSSPPSPLAAISAFSTPADNSEHSTPSSPRPTDRFRPDDDPTLKERWQLFPTSPQPSSSWLTELGSGLSPPVAARVRRASEQEVQREKERVGPQAWANATESRRLRNKTSVRSESSAGSSPFKKFEFAAEQSSSRAQITPSPSLSGDVHRFQHGGSESPASAYESISTSPKSIVTHRTDDHSLTAGLPNHGRRDRHNWRTGRSSSTPSSLSAERSFDESSWEFKVAEALYRSGPGAREQTPPLPSPSLPASSLPPSTTHTSSPQKSSLQHLQIPSPRTSPSPPSRRARFASSSPGLTIHALLDHDATTAGANGDEDTGDSESDNDSWHDAEDESIDDELEVEIETKPYEVLPYSRAGLVWEEKHGGGILWPSIEIKSAHIIDLTPSPISDANLTSSSSTFAFDESEPIVLPLPVAPIRSSIPVSFQRSPSNFLPSSPRQLERNYRLSQTTGRSISFHSTSQRRHSIDHGPQKSPSDAAFLNASTSPELSQHAVSTRLLRPFSFLRPLEVVPLGAWLFMLGFIFPPAWWVGASLRIGKKTPSTGDMKLEEIKVVPGSPTSSGPISGWPDLREGARTPKFSSSQPGARLSRVIEGTEPWLTGAQGWQVQQQSYRTWQKRNRLMSFISIILIGAVVGVGIWAGMQTH